MILCVRVCVCVCVHVCVCGCVCMCVCVLHPGFWGSEESLDGSDPQLTMSPAAPFTEDDKGDFDF